MKQVVLKFFPLLILYMLIVIVFSPPTFVGDEGGYVEMADHIARGYQSFRESTLWWGLGYPVVLTPFVFFGIPLLAAKLLNAFFLFASIIYLYKTAGFYVEDRYATIFATVLGLYPPFIMQVHLLLTESFVFFLVCGFMFNFCKLLRTPEIAWHRILKTSVILGYLALTKVIFGYVILVGLLSFLVLFIWRPGLASRKTLLVYLFALMFCVPYLLYTYSRASKIFYWGTSGGMNLYWMSASYSTDELGSWFSPQSVEERPELAPHREFFNSLPDLSEVQLDEAYKKQAIQNITRNPGTYLMNWVANVGRMLFFYPFSYKSQRLVTFIVMLPNMFIVIPFVLSIFPAILRRRLVPYEMYALIYFAAVSFFGNSLLSAYDRQFRPLIPILLLWLSYVYFRILKIELRTDTAPDKSL